MDIVDAKPAF